MSDNIYKNKTELIFQVQIYHFAHGKCNAVGIIGPPTLPLSTVPPKQVTRSRDLLGTFLSDEIRWKSFLVRRMGSGKLHHEQQQDVSFVPFYFCLFIPKD